MSHTIIGHVEADTDKVSDRDACPECGERRIDMLVWQTSTYPMLDGWETSDPYVKCSTCTFCYRPGETEG